jgi:DNA-binding CsgD family transcriptional regulator
LRAILVGLPVDRARLRAELRDAGLDIVAEATTMPEARALELEVDALVVLPAGDRWRPGRSYPDSGADDELDEPLTPREREVLAWLAEGLSNKAIARRLAISDQTVKFHIASIYGKLGAANRADAVRRAVRRGLVEI